MSVISPVRSLWRTAPEPVRALANRGFRTAAHLLTPVRVGLAWRKGNPGRGPVAVAGLHGSVKGLGEGARLLASGLRAGGLEVGAVDLGRTLAHASELDIGDDLEHAGTIITHVNPPELMEYLLRTGGRALSGRRHIGFWLWELPEAPRSWARTFRYVDEVWCPSRFAAEAVEAVAPPGSVVRVVPYPLFTLPRQIPDRARFDLPPSVCVILVAFDLRSTLARKNPEGAIEAYTLAFPEVNGRTQLLLKIAGVEQHPELLHKLQKRIVGRSDIKVMTTHLSRAEIGVLLASVDVVLSLHRAEGFGLVPAHAMRLGTPVVATAWSSTLEFMDRQSAALVDAALVPVEDEQGLYRGQVWANPDLDVAAAHLRELAEDPAYRLALGERGRVRIEAQFNQRRWSNTYVSLLTSAAQGR